MEIHCETSVVPVLSELFADYLRDLASESARDELITALGSRGLRLEHDLMLAHRDGGERWVPTPESAGVWRGHRCWLGWYPPALGEVVGGDLWFDPVEISLMILIPRTFPDLAELAELPPHFMKRSTPFVGWISVRQMAVWQAVGYSLLTGRDLRIDTESVSPSAPVSGVSPVLAWDIVIFFGKGICDAGYWAPAQEAFPAEELAELWQEDAPELGGEENSGAWIVVERADAMKGHPWEGHTDDYPYLAEAFPAPGVRFRTAVSSQSGVIDPEEGDKPNEVIDRRPVAALKGS